MDDSKEQALFHAVFLTVVAAIMGGGILTDKQGIETYLARAEDLFKSAQARVKEHPMRPDV